MKRHGITNIVNRFVESVCELRTVVLRIGQCGDADNIRLKEILKRSDLFGNQTVELLINSVGKRIPRPRDAFNPPF